MPGPDHAGDQNLELDENGIPLFDEDPPGTAGTGTRFEGIIAPRDHPVAVEDRGTTAREQHTPESLEERVWREEPEVTPGDLDDHLDVDLPGDGRVGHLVAPDSGVDRRDEEKQELAQDAGMGDGDALSAEEAAMHLTDAPPMGDGDGYLES